MAVADHDILKQALRLFAEKGYGAVTTRMIAEAAGITEMTLFRKFQTKRNILDLAIGDADAEQPELDSLFNRFVGDPAVDIPVIGHHLWHQLARGHQIFSIMVNSPEIHSHELKAFTDQNLGMLKDFFSRYVQRYRSAFKPDMDTSAAVILLSSLFLGVFILTDVTNLMPELGAESVQANSIKLLLKGMI